MEAKNAIMIHLYSIIGVRSDGSDPDLLPYFSIQSGRTRMKQSNNVAVANDVKKPKAKTNRLPGRQAGPSIVELMLVAVGAALVMGATAMAYQKYTKSDSYDRLVDSIREANSAIVAKYSNMPIATRYSGISIANVTSVLPPALKDTISGATIALNEGTIALAASSPTGTAGSSAFMWTFTNVSQEFCQKLAVGLGSAAQAVLSGTTALSNKTTGDTLTALEQDTLCANQAASNTLKMVQGM